MALTIGELAAVLGATVEGDLGLLVARPAEPALAGPDDLALAMDKSFAEGLAQGSARAAILWPGADWRALGLNAAIFVPRPRYAMAGVTGAFSVEPELEPGISKLALVHPDAVLGENVRIGPFVAIGARARIGDNARILSHVSIAEDVVIGADALIFSGVRIGARVRIGRDFIAQPNAVIGSDGFSFVTPKPGTIDSVKATGKTDGEAQGYVRINSIGSVVIGDDVEVGAACAIDRGTIADTTIGDGTKIDNLVQIGHNVKVGSTCLLCGQVGIAGSTVIGDRVVLGGQVGVADHLRIGSNVVVAGKSAISSHVAANLVMMGNPAVRMDQNVEIYKNLRRLPRLVRAVDELREQLKPKE